MTNQEIIEILNSIADLLEIKGDNPYKIKAYRRVVTSIEELAVPVSRLAAEDRLDEIPGVGEAIRDKLTELVNTGRLKYYEKLKAEFPPGVFELLQVPGIGPKTAATLYRGAGITSVEVLEKALENDEPIPHIGEKTREKLLEGIREMKNAGKVKA